MRDVLICMAVIFGAAAIIGLIVGGAVYLLLD
jgi:hypothetical protein